MTHRFRCAFQAPLVRLSRSIAVWRGICGVRAQISSTVCVIALAGLCAITHTVHDRACRPLRVEREGAERFSDGYEFSASALAVQPRRSDDGGICPAG